jgi:hypothetical protein
MPIFCNVHWYSIYIFFMEMQRLHHRLKAGIENVRMMSRRKLPAPPFPPLPRGAPAMLAWLVSHWDAVEIALHKKPRAFFLQRGRNLTANYLS